MMTTELDIARAVAEGALPSPTPWQNGIYVALRLSGTGCAFRPSVDEFVHRDADIWCSPEMLRRLVGLPIVVEHPASGTLTSREFGDAIVGIVVHAYVNEDEQAPWGIGRILDANAARLIVGGVFDTSPGVVLSPDATASIEVDGKRLLVEGPPMLLDHVALVYTGDGNKGVWTRADDPPGVQVDEV